jgi:hypothetical protein
MSCLTNQVKDTDYEIHHCEDYSTHHFHTSWALLACSQISIIRFPPKTFIIFLYTQVNFQFLWDTELVEWISCFSRTFPTLTKLKTAAFKSFNFFIRNLYCIVLKGWKLLPDVLRPFQDILCSPEFRYYTRTWICRLKFAQRPIFSGLRFVNEPEISDSGPPA